MLDEYELKRARMLLGEIDDLLNSVRNELNQSKAYKPYLAEKLGGIKRDVDCMCSLVGLDED